MHRVLSTHVRRNVVSYLALFVALGGTSYAAVSLPKNSVGSKQIKANAVTSSKVKNGSLRGADFKAAELAKLRGPAGAAGANGTNGAKGDAGATGAKGDTGATGAKGDAGRSALTALQSGETVSGDWGMGINATAGSQGFRAVADFPIPLAAGLDGSRTIYVSGASAPNCPGIGQAAAGYLCVYQGFISSANVPSSGNIFNPETSGGPPGTGKYGFSIFLSSSGAGVATVSGAYSVTGA